MKNKILLTGASGFIGSHLLRTLAKKNSFIYAVHHKNKEKLINDISNGIDQHLGVIN